VPARARSDRLARVHAEALVPVHVPRRWLPEVAQVSIAQVARETHALVENSMRSERQRDVDVELPAAGFLHKIEHVQVDVAERSDSTFVLQARGYLCQLRAYDVAATGKGMRTLPSDDELIVC
jgi:hypothetical protein